MKIRSVSPEIWAKLSINALSRNVEESFKKFLDPDPEADEFQNLIDSSLSTDISLVKFSRRFVQWLLTDRQTKGIVYLGGGNKNVLQIRNSLSFRIRQLKWRRFRTDFPAITVPNGRNYREWIVNTRGLLCICLDETRGRSKVRRKSTGLIPGWFTIFAMSD